MLQRFTRFIQQQHLLFHGQEVLLAVSGGRDSVTMVDLFRRAGYPFSIAHCNFHLRPGDCDRDQQFVQHLAERLGVKFHTVDFDTRTIAASTGESIEQAARRLRYEFFSSLITHHSSLACVATAHHRDDSIETFFLNLFRGTGIAGLHGIRPISELRVKSLELRIIRPLLCFSREEIDRYVEENRLEYVEDHTNYEPDARRNAIRLRLMPLLRELYPAVDLTMAANIERLHDTELFYKEYIEKLRSSFITPHSSLVPDLPFQILSLDLPQLTSLHSSHSLLYELLHPFGFNASQVADILQSKTTGKQFLSITHIAELHRGLLLVAPITPPVPPATQSLSHSATQPLATPHFRLWRPGDRFHPKGMKGTRLVSDFLKDLHLSRIEKAHVWLLVDDDGRIRSIVGLRDAEI